MSDTFVRGVVIGTDFILNLLALRMHLFSSDMTACLRSQLDSHALTKKSQKQKNNVAVCSGICLYQPVGINLSAAVSAWALRGGKGPVPNRILKLPGTEGCSYASVVSTQDRTQRKCKLCPANKSA